MKKLLIIDDSRLTRRQLARLLTAPNVAISEAGNGREGLEALDRDRPDCILTDVLMPEMDGIQFLAQARKKGVQTPIIVISSDAQTPPRIKQLTELGATAVVDKPPAGEAALLAIVAQLLS